MRSHMILLSSSYSKGTRIALEFLERDFHNVQGVIDEIIDKCHGDMPFSVHSLGTPDETWESVWKTDPCPGSPWTHCDSSKANEQIDDSVIRKFHDVEEV